VCALLLGVGDARPEDSIAQARHINPQRLQATLERLSAFGRNPEGGVTRLGFSQTDLDARTYVTGLMKDAGLEVRVDPVVFGRRSGSEQLPTLLFGSHIDSVPHGGNFDGPLGSLGAIEVIRALNDGLITTRHPLEVVIWTNEEGPHFGISALGSGVAAGVLGPEILDRKDDDGQTVADWLRRYGQDPAHLTDARIAPGALAAILELHIEQGPVLEESKVQIGVVSGIVSLKRRKCVTTGFANHAGTTPMNRRKDALAAAAKHLLSVRDVVRAESGTQVGIVGYMKAEPGAPSFRSNCATSTPASSSGCGGALKRNLRKPTRKKASRRVARWSMRSRLPLATRRGRASSATPRSRPASRPWICRAAPCTTPERYRGLRRWA
jgi:N-carbamoyl-L-amino-acid hydrolase